jgi:hypothetical protein
MESNTNEGDAFMKKFLLGLLVGMGLMLTGAVYADDINTDVQSLIGQTVQGTFPVQVNGTQIQNAIVVNNTSYLPARMIAEIFNSDVSFIDNQVIVKAKDGAAVNANKLAQWQKDKDANQKVVDDLRAKAKAEEDALKQKQAEGAAAAKQLEDDNNKRIQEAQQQQQQTQTTK